MVALAASVAETEDESAELVVWTALEASIDEVPVSSAELIESVEEAAVSLAPLEDAEDEDESVAEAEAESLAVSDG